MKNKYFSLTNQITVFNCYNLVYHNKISVFYLVQLLDYESILRLEAGNKQAKAELEGVSLWVFIT